MKYTGDWRIHLSVMRKKRFNGIMSSWNLDTTDNPPIEFYILAKL